MIVSPIASTSLEHAVGAAHAEFGAAMVADRYYILVANTDMWFAQADAPVASAGAGSMFLPAKTPVILNGSAGADVSVIQDSAVGKASLTRVLLY